MTKHELRFLDHTRLTFVLKGIVIGALTGITVSLFRLGIGTLTERCISVYKVLPYHPLWILAWLLLMIGSAIIVGLLIRSEPMIKGSGIPQVEGQLQEELDYNWFSVLWKKFIGGLIAVGSGLFLGREGPSIQLGATIGQGFAETTKTTGFERKIFISSGASAGLSAAFNAPIAGLMFIIEEIHHTFSPLVWLTAFASALTANMVSLYVFGLKPVLYLGELQDMPLKDYWLLIVFAILLGLFARLYQVVLLGLPKWYSHIKLPIAFHGIVPFILIVPIGLLFPDLLGGGHQVITGVEAQTWTILPLIGVLVLRFVFSMVSYGASLPGGIFLPILTLGALAGALFALIAIRYLDLDDVYMKNFIIVGMAGYFAAIGKAPLTAIILITEMVGSLHHLMATGMVALIAYLVVDTLGGAPIYESLLARLVGQHETTSTKQTVIEYPITLESPYVGKTIREIKWPDHVLIVSIQRGDQVLLINGDTLIKAGDILTIFTTKEHLRTIRSQLYTVL